MNYIRFASKISFYEFLQDEFKSPHFNTDDYLKEIPLLSPNITIEGLLKKLEEAPKIFDVAEELFQLDHFTDAQYIHFCFDVNVLNNSEVSLVLKYIANRVYKFENGKGNTNFQKIYAKISSNHPGFDQQTVFFTKRAIVNYISKLMDRKQSRKRKILYEHIENSIETRLRISKYLIENLNATSLLASVNLEKFLKQKRHPVDTKGLRGKFGVIKISRILQDTGFVDLSSDVEEKTLLLEGIGKGSPMSAEFSFVTEKYVDNVIKRKSKKPKKFDFVLLYRGVPKVLIETNFFSTSGGGTKIGINEGEYTDLHNDIQKLNNEHHSTLRFMWITDGNYWLSKNGEGRFQNLKQNFFTGEFELLNYNLFREILPSLKESLKSEGQ